MVILRGLERQVDLFCSRTPHLEKIPRKRTIQYPVRPIQGEFDLGFPLKQVIPLPGLRGRVGLYSELLCCTVLDGKLHHNHRYVPGVVQSDKFEFEYCQPDVFNPQTKQSYEVKAVRSGGDLQLKDEQLNRYFFMLLDKEHNTPIKGHNFAVVRHNLRHANKLLENLSEEEQLELFSKSAIFMVCLPFSVAYPIFDSPNYLQNGKRVSSRYDGDKYETMTRLRSGALNNLFFSPEQFLEQVFLSPEDYIIFREKVYNLHVKGNEVHTIPPLPILTIQDKNTKQWLERFRERYKGRREEAKKVIQEAKEQMVFDFFDNLAPGKPGDILF